MSDEALIAWLEGGARVELPATDAASRLSSEFARRFVESLNSLGDLGITEEEHELGVARNVYEVHAELNRLGDEAYSATWSLLSAPVRRAIKAYVELARRSCG